MKNDIATTSSVKKRFLNTPPTGDLKGPAPSITLVMFKLKVPGSADRYATPALEYGVG